MKNIKKYLAIATIAFASFSSSASLINVGGVEWDPDHPIDLFGVAGLIYQETDLATGDLSGYGRVTKFNGLDAPDLCPGCELTFHFGGYSESIIDSGLTTDTEYNGGWLKMWVDFTPDTDNGDPTLLTFANTGHDGFTNDLWLDLTGHIIGGTETTFLGEIDFTGALSGSGAFDVVGGLAAPNLNTDSFLLPVAQTITDIIFSSDFTKPMLDQTGTKLIAYGSADFAGESIPEPSSIAIFALGLIGLAIGKRKINL